MTGLKTLDDNAAAAQAAEAAAKAVQPPAGGAIAEAAGGAAAPANPALAALMAERDAAVTRADTAEGDYLAQSDKLAEANAALVKFKAELAELTAAADKGLATITKLEAQVVALGAAPAEPEPTIEIKRPKPGKVLKLPEEGKRAKGDDVLGGLDAGGLLVLVLVDDNARVQSYAARVGGADLFAAQGGGLLFTGAIDLMPDLPPVEMRAAVVLDIDGKVLSSCRLGALLLGGGGLSAMIPGNSLRFEFD